MTEYENAGSTLDLMDFTNIRDGGVVETPTSYAMLIKVKPREWLILSEEEEQSLYTSFVTFLRGVQFPTQILSMTTAYDPEPYLERFEDAQTPLIRSTNGDEARTEEPDESPLLDFGRKYHTEWLRNVVDVADIRDRNFYVAVSVSKSDESGGDFLDKIRSYLPDRGGIDIEGPNEAECLEEVNARAQRVASKLPQTRVETEILDTRSTVLEVLYEVYHGEKPPISFTQGNFTTPSEDVHDIAYAAYDAEEVAQAEVNEDGGFEFERASEGQPEIETEPDTEPLEAVGDGGFAHPDFVKRVSKSSILKWYARNIGPVGHGSQPVVPREIYAGVFLGLLSLVLGAVALGSFVWTMSSVERGTDIYWLLRTASFVTAPMALLFLFSSIVALFPSGRKTKALAVGGVAIGAYAVSKFLSAYPAEWGSAAVTTLTVVIYAVGLVVLLVAVVLAVRSRQRVDLSDLTATPGPEAEAIADGGAAVPDGEPGQGSEDDEMADTAEERN
jgi:hypothetical protein